MLSTQLDGDILKPQFAEQLRYLRERCGTQAERERCDHLAASLLFTSQICPQSQRPKQQQRPQRPHTAMAALGCEPDWDPYETTMNRDYVHRAAPLVHGERPRSTKGYQTPYKLSDPIGDTHYNDEFSWKPFCKAEQIRTATSSGARCNNPIPSQAFMTWRLPRKGIQVSVASYSPWSKPPSLEEAEKIIKAQYNSTYKRDYLGIPPGFQVKHAFRGSTDWKNQIPRTLNTEFRTSYQIPQHIPILAESDFKYGAYANIHCARKGVVPTVTLAHMKNQENRILRSTYQRHYGHDYLDLPLLLCDLDSKEVKDYQQKVPKEERVECQPPPKSAIKKDKKLTSALPEATQCVLHRPPLAPPPPSE